MLVGTSSMRSLVPRSPPTILGMCAKVNSRIGKLPPAVSVGIFTVALSGVSRSRGPMHRKQMRATPDSLADTNEQPEEPEEERLGPFYHYTNQKGANGINESGTIRPSTDRVRDAAGGEGIYVTDLDPEEHSKPDILKNNYIQENTGNKDHADYYVGLTVSTERWDVEEVPNRDHVYVITDKDGSGREMRVTGSDTLARPKPDYSPDCNPDDDDRDSG